MPGWTAQNNPSTGWSDFPTGQPEIPRISFNESVTAQAVAQVAKENPAMFLEFRSGGSLAAIKREVFKSQRKLKLQNTEWPSGQYRVLYADPPWQYGDARTGTPESGGANAQYETMPVESICRLEIRKITLNPSVLFLWATSPLIPEAIEVLRAWDFAYKASFVWDKLRGFNGHYNDVHHELLLVATRGSCLPESQKLIPSIVHCAKDHHSSKPKMFREIIDALYPTGPRIELFAREKVKGWECWGNEAV